MTKGVYTLILLSVTLSAFAQVALKAGMASGTVQRSLASSDAMGMAGAIALQPLVILGLFLYFVSAAVWLLVLAKVEVSFAYPFVALGFILTALFGRILFDDSFSAAKIAGTMLIVSGVVVLARG